MKRIPLPLEEIKKLYLVGLLTVREIAERYWVSSQSISYRLSMSSVQLDRRFFKESVLRSSRSNTFASVLLVDFIKVKAGCPERSSRAGHSRSL